MKFKWKQGIAAVAATSALSFAFASVSGAADVKEKLPSWAATEIASWKDIGLIKGDAQGNILPNNAITRAEFIAFINRVFNYPEQSGMSFKDVPRTAWYAADFDKAVAAGALIGDSSGEMSPLRSVTREEAAAILSRVFHVTAAREVGTRFKDDAQIANWSKEAVYALKASGYVAGTPDGSFQPKKALTRAEAVKMIDNVMGTLIADGQDHASLSGDNLVVNTAGGTLSNLHLNRNLYITPGVGEGDLKIVNAKIGGTIYVNGGGANSISITDTQAAEIVINKKKSPVRIIFAGTTQVPRITLESGSILDNQMATEIREVILNSELQGEFVFNGKYGTVNVTKSASENTITFAQQASVQSFVANSGAKVVGAERILQAIINVLGVQLDQAPKTLELNAGEVTINGKAIKKGQEQGIAGAPGGGTSLTSPTTNLSKRYTYEEATAALSSDGAEGLVKQYIAFLLDETYKPSVANPTVAMPDLTNAITFVNAEFSLKPSLFPSLRGVNTSVLNETGTLLWVGTDQGVTKINLKNNAMTSYTTQSGDLTDNRVMLLIDDGINGVFTITQTGVSHIYR